MSALTAHELPARPDDAPLAAKLVAWKPSSVNGLLGHATIAFSSGWIVHKIPIFQGWTDKLSVGVPSDGSDACWPVITFENGAANLRYQRTVLDAVQAAGVVP
jgi:hypothetical protein